MIIDAILDRKDGFGYGIEEMSYIMGQARHFGFKAIADAFRLKSEDSVKRALCDYIISQDYNLDIIPYVLSCDWIIGKHKD